MALESKLLPGQGEQRSKSLQPHVTPAGDSPQLLDAIRETCTTLGIDHDLAECIAAGAQARMRTALTIDGITGAVRSVHPDVRVNVTFSVHRSWLDFLSNHTRTLPQAQEIAAAIVAEYGGSVAVTPLPESTVCDGAVKVTLASGDLGTTDVDIFYGKGVPQACSSAS